MPRENQYQAIILKASAFAEADELITIFTKEAGKIRALAKATKKSESKLRYGLQPASVSTITLSTSTTLPKIIRATPSQTFSSVLLDEARAACWFVIAELSIRGTADEQKNETLFNSIETFLER